MLSVGNQFPDFNLTAVNGTSPESFSAATLASYGADWKIIFFTTIYSVYKFIF